MAAVETTDDGAIRIITLNRPERRNALDFASLVALRAAFAEARQNPALRALVLTGRGGAFSAGADVREWAEQKASGIVSHDWVGEALQLMQEVFSFPKPAVA